jgi:DNA replication protein DnaC
LFAAPDITPEVPTMLSNNTVGKLHEMKLSVMAKVFREQLDSENVSDLSFEERFGLLVDEEWAARKTNRLKRLIRNASYEIPGACIEDIEYHPDRKLDKAQIARLATCKYIDEHHNIIILGATGNGKTYLSNAFGMAASRNFYTVRYIRLPELLGELAIARGEGRYQKAVKQYKQAKLLILDEWLLFPISESDARDILDIVNARHKRASTIFCSQFAPEGWYHKIGEPAVADAICDRIVHDSYTILIDGGGMRKRKGIMEA